MENFKTFKTKKRDWHELVRTINYGYYSQNIKKINKELYNNILKKLIKEKTDGVILAGEAGTIGSEFTFIPFSLSSLTKKELKIIEKLNC